MRVLIVYVLATLATLGSVGAPAALAGQCRADLRPLLLDARPAATDLDRVRTLCRAEADGGDADAVYGLALFDLGLGGTWQPDPGIALMRQAAAGGVPEAQYWLAWQSEAGPLLPHDPAVALGWYQRAAALNHRLAIGRLARAYAAGELGLRPDPLKAAEYRARQSQCMRQAAGDAAG